MVRPSWWPLTRTSELTTRKLPEPERKPLSLQGPKEEALATFNSNMSSEEENSESHLEMRLPERQMVSRAVNTDPILSEKALRQYSSCQPEWRYWRRNGPEPPPRKPGMLYQGGAASFPGSGQGLHGSSGNLLHSGGLLSNVWSASCGGDCQVRGVVAVASIRTREDRWAAPCADFPPQYEPGSTAFCCSSTDMVVTPSFTLSQGLYGHTGRLEEMLVIFCLLPILSKFPSDCLGETAA